MQTDDSGIVNGPRVTPAGAGPLPDPLLQSAHDTVAEQTQRVQPLLLALGGDLWRVVRDRLVERGLVRAEERRWLGVFRSTRWPADDERHEAQLRVRIRRVLEDGAEPDPRTAAIIGLLSASGSLPSLRPPLPWTARTATRAQELQRGDWGPAAVGTAVARTAAGIAAASAAATISVSIDAR